MPRRSDLKSILIIGSGPIIIGQACEFDYSGTQACKVLKNDGYRIVLINSNPATIMTDPQTADRIYIEPITPENIKKIILKEGIDAVLPTIGGQTSLNMVVQIAEDGFFEENGIELIGADIPAIKRAEDRKVFQEVIKSLGYNMIEAHYAHSKAEAMEIIKGMEFPVIIRASFTLGGTGGSVAYNIEEFQEIITKGLSLSLIREVTIEKSMLGFKEFELEVMKDNKDNVVIVCSIENFDPLGIHTGDSITVAPQQTLSDREYQNLRNMSINIIKAIGVSTGGANIQFTIDPTSREVYVIEMNPRVSRSSALASKATGFPIAKIAAKLAVGYSLDEIQNDITRVTPSCFEPTIDYVVTKIPRFDFEKFTTASPVLGVQMKSVGETMAIGRSFKESFQKAIRGLENKRIGFDGNIFSYNKIKDFNEKALADYREEVKSEIPTLKQKVIAGDYERIYYIKDLFYLDFDLVELYELTKIEIWFLHQLKEIFDLERKYWKKSLSGLSKEELLSLKQNGFSDPQLAIILDCSPDDVRTHRKSLDILPNYKIVDTCAGEFPSITPYYYSTYDEESELDVNQLEKPVIIFGGGPNRIGQGIEFDYMCVQASNTLRQLGYHAIMVNSNPETVSTDYDVSDRLFFEPLTAEDTLNIIDQVNPVGVIIHLGGQTPLNLADTFEKYQIPILGTSQQSILLTENREEFRKILDELECKQPASNTTKTMEDGLEIAKQIGYPVLIRPSFVLGGKAMKIVHDESQFKEFFQLAMLASDQQPVLIDRFLEGAIEVDVDLICDQEKVLICGIMEHIEEAGVHSGDSACALPPINLSNEMISRLVEQSRKIALKIKVKGFMNIQYALKDDEIYLIEANPRGSRTVPFISKALGVSWTNLGVKVIMGHQLTNSDMASSFEKIYSKMKIVAVKEVALPFNKFPDEDIILGPEMKSTGEVMGVGKNIYEAFYKSQEAIQSPIPKDPCGVLISIKTKEYEDLIPTFKTLSEMGYKLYATEGTHEFLSKHQVPSIFVNKLGEGKPDVGDLIINDQIKLIFNTPIGKEGKISDTYIRLLAKQHKISVFTVPEAFPICVNAIKEVKERDFHLYALDEYQN